jgi:hypothetical protein
MFISRSRVVLQVLVSLFLGSPLLVSAQTPTSISLVALTPCGKNPIATVNLSGPAPAGGLVIQLSSSIPSAASVPASVTAAAGASSASFTVTCVQIAQSLAVNISATANGVTQTALINVVPLAISGISADPHTGGPSVNARVSLIAPAPAGGLIVTLTRSGPVNVPSSVTVPAGAASVTFSVAVVTEPPVVQPTIATITGSLGGVTKGVDLTIVPVPLSALGFRSGSNFVPSISITGGMTQGMIILSGGTAPAGGVTVQLSSGNPTVASVPATGTVPAGVTGGSFDVVTHPVAQLTQVTITATAGGISKSAELTVLSPTLSEAGLVLQPSIVVGGLSTEVRVLLNGPAAAGGLRVDLSSSNTSVARVVKSVTVPAGALSASSTVQTFLPTGVGSANATIQARVGAFARSALLTVTRR